jgi:penicillin-binding protein 2
MNSFDLFGNPTDDKRVTDLPNEDSPSYTASLDQLEDTIEEDRQPDRSFLGIIVVAGISLAALAFQTFRLQVVESSINQAKADGNSIRLISLPADRGLITDAKGLTLAQNTRQLALAINPQDLPVKKSERQKVYAVLRAKTGIDDKTIATIEANRLKSPETFVIKDNLSKDELLLDKEYLGDTKGVIIQEEPIRNYAQLPSLGHVLGYVGPVNAEDLKNGHTLDQHIGKTGLEQVYNEVLTGVPGKRTAEVNASGEIDHYLPGADASAAKPGQTLKLSLDSKLQQIVADALQHGLDRRKKLYGDLKQWGASAVFMDPATGAVKAMVSLPDYNDQQFAQGITAKQYDALLNDPAHPLVNRAIQDQLPSGSVLKPMIAAAGLQEKVISSDTSMVTPLQINIGQFSFPDWKYHGLTNTRKAIAESNDIFFYAVGGGWQEKGFSGLGIDRLNAYLRKFGLGSPDNIDLPGEQSGLIADPAWKLKHIGEPWYIGDTYHSSIGQGFTLVTPLQMASATAAVVNGGTVWEPRMAWSTVDPITNKETLIPHIPLSANVISPENLQVVREGMRETVLSGSARPLSTLKVTSAGKTGTAEFGNQGLTHAWFTGFAPYDNPELVYAISIEAGGESFDSSLPVTEEILRNYFGDPLAPGQKLNSEPGVVPVPPEFHGEH